MFVFDELLCELYPHCTDSVPFTLTKPGLYCSADHVLVSRCVVCQSVFDCTRAREWVCGCVVCQPQCQSVFDCTCACECEWVCGRVVCQSQCQSVF